MLFFMGLNALFGRVFGLNPQLAFLAAYPPALALHFLLNKLWTFGDRTATTHLQLGEYLFSVVVTFLINWPAFLFFNKAIGLPGWLAAGGANLLQMSASYALLRWRVFHGTSGSDSGPQSNPWRRLAILLATLCGVALLYWSAYGGWKAPHFRSDERDYYNLLVSGFRKGSLAMDVPVPEALKNAENPWDPAKRPAGSTLHDASYFNGHYYLYFGVVPAVLLFWPFRALVGLDLTLPLATVLYLSGAFLIAAWLWLRILRERFARAGTLTSLAGVVVLGLCAGQLALARRPSIWEMPIAAGHFYLICMVACAYVALSARKPWAALSGAGLSLGLAIGCRPPLAGAGAGLAVLVMVVGWRGTGIRERLRRFLAALSAAGVPFAAVVGGLLSYNRARFGKLFEFGLNYQLTGANEAKAQHFLPRFAPFNLEAYFVRAPQWGRYFPFIHPIVGVAPPAGYYGMEYVYGALVVCPVIWGVVFALGLLLRRRQSVEGAFGLILLAMALATTAFLACFNTAAARYVPDFLTWWLWAALLGWAWLESECAAPTLRSLATTALGICAAFSLVLALLQSAALHGIFESEDPEAYHRISGILDRPAAAWEHIFRQPLGPVTLEVHFPDHGGSAFEPLLVSGVEYESDYYFVYYKSQGVIRLGFANSGDPPLYSDDISIIPGRGYRLRFEGGSLYPPTGHPAYAEWTEAQVQMAKSDLSISVDDRTVLHQQRQFHDGAPEFLQVGVDNRSGAFGRRFSGAISAVRREPLEPPADAAWTPGDVVMDVTLPDELVPGSQPLVVVGRTGSAELVGYRSVDSGHFALTYEKWGVGYWESAIAKIPQSREATFRIRLGSLMGGSISFPKENCDGSLMVWMNGQPLWWRQALGGTGPQPPVEFLANTIGSSAMRAAFQGKLLSLRREPLPLWKTGAFKSLELDLEGMGSGVEPIVTTGLSGKTDSMAIEWLPGDHARLVLNHSGNAPLSSREFAWSPETIHHLKLTLPGFSALDAREVSSGTGVLRAVVDGAVAWEVEVPFFGADSPTIAFGTNTSVTSHSSLATTWRLGDIHQDFAQK
jgi:putative flippase GtrA